MEAKITEGLNEHLGVFRRMSADPELLGRISEAAGLIVACYRAGGKVLLCGNGGSAGDAQHIAAELSGRFRKDRAPLYAEALHVNTSYITAVSNDYHFREVYSRMVEACGKSGDILIAISTSGNSENVLQAAQQAHTQAMTVIGLTGEQGGALAGLCDTWLGVPSGDVPRIQEAHIFIGHTICELVESSLFPDA